MSYLEINQPRYVISCFYDTDQPMQPCRLISIIISMALKEISYYISFRFSPSFSVASDYNTKNYHECEGGIAKSVRGSPFGIAGLAE